MIKSNSLRVHLLVLLYDTFRSGLSHAESGRIHGVSPRTSNYASKWCRRTHPKAESFVSRQSLRDLHYYRTMISCLQSVKDTKFESNSQPYLPHFVWLNRCLQSVKDTKFESNSQPTLGDLKNTHSCLQSVKDTKFESNSQLIY